MMPPAQFGQPSGLECNGCGLELDVGVPHECLVLGNVVRVDPITATDDVAERFARIEALLALRRSLEGIERALFTAVGAITAASDAIDELGKRP